MLDVEFALRVLCFPMSCCCYVSTDVVVVLQCVSAVSLHRAVCLLLVDRAIPRTWPAHVPLPHGTRIEVYQLHVGGVLIRCLCVCMLLAGINHIRPIDVQFDS